MLRSDEGRALARLHVLEVQNYMRISIYLKRNTFSEITCINHSILAFLLIPSRRSQRGLFMYFIILERRNFVNMTIFYCILNGASRPKSETSPTILYTSDIIMVNRI